MRSISFRDQMTIFLSKTHSKIGLLQQKSPLVGLSLNRSQPNFTQRDRLMLNLLCPHLSQAYHNAQHYHHLQASLDQLQQSLDLIGIIFLDQHGRVRSITAQASRWLQEYFPGPHHPHHLPDTLQSWVNYQITQLHHTDPYPALLPLRIQRHTRQLTIRLTINQPQMSYFLLLGEDLLVSPLPPPQAPRTQSPRS